SFSLTLSPHAELTEPTRGILNTLSHTLPLAGTPLTSHSHHVRSRRRKVQLPQDVHEQPSRYARRVRQVVRPCPRAHHQRRDVGDQHQEHAAHMHVQGRQQERGARRAQPAARGVRGRQAPAAGDEGHCPGGARHDQVARAVHLRLPPRRAHDDVVPDPRAHRLHLGPQGQPVARLRRRAPPPRVGRARPRPAGDLGLPVRCAQPRGDVHLQPRPQARGELRRGGGVCLWHPGVWVPLHVCVPGTDPGGAYRFCHEDPVILSDVIRSCISICLNIFAIRS
ncbi:unnamed protein product, partial [Mycena citricolor]